MARRSRAAEREGPDAGEARVLSQRFFRRRDALYLMRLQAGQDLAGEALDLRHVEIVR